MGVTQWQDPERYIRNSPLLHVQNVNTPLLIIHGDMDFVPIMQAEEIFTGLHHDSKRVEFVRYWGEHHAPNNPANIRDMWARIFAWCDGFGDIQRDGDGHLVFEGDKVHSRDGKLALTPADFMAFEKKAVRQEVESQRGIVKIPR